MIEKKTVTPSRVYRRISATLEKFGDGETDEFLWRTLVRWTRWRHLSAEMTQSSSATGLDFAVIRPRSELKFVVWSRLAWCTNGEVHDMTIFSRSIFPFAKFFFFFHLCCATTYDGEIKSYIYWWWLGSRVVSVLDCQGWVVFNPWVQ